MSHQWESETPEQEKHFRSAQHLSQRLATVVQDHPQGSFMTREDEDPFRSTRPSATVSFPPRSFSIPATAQQAPYFATHITASAGPTVRYPTVGETESLLGPVIPSTFTSAPPRTQSNPTTLAVGSIMHSASTGEIGYQPWPLSSTWLTTDPPRPYGYPAIPQNPAAAATVQYSASERPTLTTPSLPPGLPNNPTPTQHAALNPRPDSPSLTTEAEEACCLQCAKGSHDLQCGSYRTHDGNRCTRCSTCYSECTSIPAEYLPWFRTIQQLYRAGRENDALAARKAWVASMEAEATKPYSRIERQLFLLNRNVESLLRVSLRTVRSTCGCSLKIF